MKKLLCLSFVLRLLSSAATAQSPTPAPSLPAPPLPHDGSHLIYHDGAFSALSADTTIRDSNGKIIGRYEVNANDIVIRDENGKIVGRIEKPNK